RANSPHQITSTPQQAGPVAQLVLCNWPRFISETGEFFPRLPCRQGTSIQYLEVEEYSNAIRQLWQQALVAVEERIDTLNVAENLGLREGNPPGDPICSPFVPIHV